jgi:hypothetical protein
MGRFVRHHPLTITSNEYLSRFETPIFSLGYKIEQVVYGKTK